MNQVAEATTPQPIVLFLLLVIDVLLGLHTATAAYALARREGRTRPSAVGFAAAAFVGAVYFTIRVEEVARWL